MKSFTWLRHRACLLTPPALQLMGPVTCRVWLRPLARPMLPPPAPPLLLLFAWLGSRRFPALLSGSPTLQGHSSPASQKALLGPPGLSPPPGHRACIADVLRVPGACLPGGSALRQLPKEQALVPSQPDGRLNTAAAITPRGRVNLEPSLSRSQP